jgi:phosphoenolpyruvate-protein phosphotransferase
MPTSRTISGVAVTSGLALGPVHVIRSRQSTVPIWTVPPEAVASELGRLAEALNRAHTWLEETQHIVARDTGEMDAQIFAVHQMILRDPEALRRVETTIQEQRVNAEAAVQMLVDEYEARIGRLEGEHGRGHVGDVRDPWRLVLDALSEEETSGFVQGEGQVVLAAQELTPQVATLLPRERVLGIVAEEGGRFSHGAVLARSYGIPTVIGLPNLLARLEQDMVVAIDADLGEVRLRPDPEDIEALRVRQERMQARRAELERGAGLPALTSDGQGIDVLVNVASVRDLEIFDVEHTDGVGLLRTEFLYLERGQFPSEEEQYRLYRRVVEHMAPRPVTFRVLDIGGDKQLPYFKTPEEENPALGWRGLRMTLAWQDLLRVQLRAILRASAHGSAWILLPMVTSVEEVEAVREILARVQTSLDDQGYEMADRIPLGVMIEVPSLVFILDHMAARVDFVSVGTNDLVQYVLAVDRDNPRVSHLYDTAHPAVVEALFRCAEVARLHDLPCSVCGDLAGDPAYAALLLGMGYGSVSVASGLVPEIKDAVRRLSAAECKAFASEARAAQTSSVVRQVLARIRERL